MKANSGDKKIIDLFVDISRQGKSRRKFSLLFLLTLLIVGIYGAIKIDILMLFVPVVGVIITRRFVNPLHDKNIKKYLLKNQVPQGLAQTVLSLPKEQKLQYCKEALLIEIRSDLQKKNFLPAAGEGSKKTQNKKSAKAK